MLLGIVRFVRGLKMEDNNRVVVIRDTVDKKCIKCDKDGMLVDYGKGIKRLCPKHALEEL